MKKLFLLTVAALSVSLGAGAQTLKPVKITPENRRVSVKGSPSLHNNILAPRSNQRGVAAHAGEKDSPSCKYTFLMSNLFYGLAADGTFLDGTIVVGPVFTPIRYSNFSDITTGMTFTWTYDDTSGKDNTYTGRSLSVTYGTDYSTPATTLNNFYSFPVLSGTSAAATQAPYQYPGMFQAGGAAVYPMEDGELKNFGLSVVDPVTEGFALYSDGNVPVAGYSPESDAYWSRYTFGGDFDSDNWSRRIGYANFFQTPDSPIVINGVTTLAYGKIKDGVELRAEVYPLSSDYVIGEVPEAVAVCKGDQIPRLPGADGLDLLPLVFKFDEPVVLSKKDCEQFVVAITGFNDPENVEYFSPLMSAEQNPNDLGLGWVMTQLKFEGTLMPVSWSTVSYFTNDVLVAFYINLDAEYPWLKCETDAIDIKTLESVSVDFNSYYDADEFKFSGVPGWLNVSAEGRYGDTKVTFTANRNAILDTQTTVTVSTPGFSHDILVNLTAEENAVDAIEADENAGREVIYTIDGRRLNSIAEPGIYIVNGKKVVKSSVN